MLSEQLPFFLFLKSVNLTHTTLCFVLQGKQTHFYLLLSIPGVSLALWEDFLVEISFLILTKIQDWMGEELVIKLFFFFLKVRKLSPCFLVGFSLTHPHAGSKIAHSVSFSSVRKMGFIESFFSPCLSAQPLCLGAFYKLQWDVLLPISSFQMF